MKKTFKTFIFAAASLIGCAPDYTMEDLFQNYNAENVNDTNDIYISGCGDLEPDDKEHSNGAGGSGGNGGDAEHSSEEYVCEDESDVIDDGNPCSYDHCHGGITVHDPIPGATCQMSNGFYGWCNQRYECTQFLVCEENHYDCNANPADGCETQTDGLVGTNCGGCGITCIAPQQCVSTPNNRKIHCE